MPLNAGDYAIIVLLATLSSIATTPIPSSSLVLTLIIAEVSHYTSIFWSKTDR